jgi:hypothetical protein
MRQPCTSNLVAPRQPNTVLIGYPTEQLIEPTDPRRSTNDA